MTRRALVIGGTGFAGQYLARRLADRYVVTTTGRDSDVRSSDSMRTAVEGVRPEIVAYLAALTTVRETMERPRDTYEVGFTGLLNLFEALKEAGFRGRVLYVSSSEVYGYPEAQALPLTEQQAPRPVSPYAVAKLAGEALCQQWNHTGPFEIVVVRPFTHTGPGQSTRFAIANFASQIAEVLVGRRRPAAIAVGDLTGTRDLTDVRDVVRAYDVALHQGRSGEVYNVCSGREVPISDVLNQLIGLSGETIIVERDETLPQGSEHRRFWGSHARLSADTHWLPEIALRQTLVDLLESEKRRHEQADAVARKASGLSKASVVAS